MKILKSKVFIFSRKACHDLQALNQTGIREYVQKNDELTRLKHHISVNKTRYPSKFCSDEWVQMWKVYKQPVLFTVCYASL